MKTAKVFCPPGTLLGLFVWTWELEPRGLKREFGMGWLEPGGGDRSHRD